MGGAWEGGIGRGGAERGVRKLEAVVGYDQHRSPVTVTQSGTITVHTHCTTTSHQPLTTSH